MQAEWASTSNANKEAHLENARQRAKMRAAEKATARERADAKMKERIQAAREEKANDAVATKALNARCEATAHRGEVSSQ